MKKLMSVSLWMFAIVSIVLVLFVAFNESYTFKDANIALLVWRTDIEETSRIRHYELPIGFGNIYAEDLRYGGTVKIGGWGSSHAGNAMAIYITPDILPFIWGMSLIMAIIVVVGNGVFWVGEILYTKLADINRRRLTRPVD